MTSEAEGEVENDDGVLVIKRIHVRYRLRVDPDADRAAIELGLRAPPSRCPVYRSISATIAITTELELV